MGWYGEYCDGDLNSIKKELEKGLTIVNSAGVKQTMLHHSFKFGTSYFAIEQIFPDGERIVFCLVKLWRYSKKDGQVMVKTLDETCGPVECECPQVILKKLTPTTSEYANEWRKKCWSKFKRIPAEFK